MNKRSRLIAFALIVSLMLVTSSALALESGRLPVTNRPAAELPPLDRSMSVSWPVANTWNDAMEHEYSDFVQQLGRAVSERRCQHIDDCIRNPSANSLYDAATDSHFSLRVDCADLPYVLRAYFAFKRRLPFGFVSDVTGLGNDSRYMVNVHPDAWKTWRNFETPRDLLREIGSLVHSGMYRTAPGIEDGDFYQAAINRRAIHPGSIFYDPNGHVLVVAEVRDDGVVYLMDGHPDGSLTWKRFGEAFVTGTARLGGGFKNFRPLVWHEGFITRVPNHLIADFDGRSQFDHSVQVIHDQPASFHAWIRASLAEANITVDPVVEFREQVRALCRDVADRADAVNTSIAAGINTRPHPDSLPGNIYGTDGDWEEFSTPSRDARLKASFRELRDTVAAIPDGARLASVLRSAWREETARPDCAFQYVNSRGATVSLSMDDVLNRLFTLSFDPYNCPETRWGAVPGSAEASSCIDDAGKHHWYVLEQRLRNRIDREYGLLTPLDFGPTVSPDIDVRTLLDSLSPEPPPASLASLRAIIADAWRAHHHFALLGRNSTTLARIPVGAGGLGGGAAAFGAAAATIFARRLRSRGARERTTRSHDAS